MIAVTGIAGQNRKPWRIATLAPAILLAGCAGARITGFTAVGSTATAPETIVVDVAVPASSDRTLRDVAAKLENRLVKDMRKRGLPAISTARPGSVPATRLDLRIVDYRRGDEVARMLIGFGAGKSAMTVAATLVTPGGSSFTLDARAHSGARPGLILPGGVAAATGEVMHLAIGGTIRIAAGLHDGGGGDIARISRVVSRRVAAYYKSSPPS